ncbi:MAG: carboxypeptidase-like regulatory domain-containing protein [Gemmatimonadales bacterium]
MVLAPSIDFLQAPRVFTPQGRTLLLLSLLSVFANTQRGHGQQVQASIQGRVISRSGEPISGAETTIIGSEAAALTDSAGRFQLVGIPPGVSVLRVRRIGFKAQHLLLNLEAAAVPTVEIMLDPGPQVLPEIVVTAKEAKPVEFAWTTKYDDFFRRKGLGLPGGTFITADEIHRRPAMHTAELLEHYVPGARVIMHFPGDGGTEIVFPRCSRATGFVGVWVDGRKFHVGPEYQQAPDIRPRLPGQRPSQAEVEKARRMATQLADILDLIPVSQIQFMEVYRGIGSIPGVFSGGCGAIAIWTK